MHRDNESIFGIGECLSCGKQYRIDIGCRSDPEISGLLSRISARSLSMPLIFFDGLKVACYVGGIGGSEYLQQAKYVAEKMGFTFPPIVIWRPRDIYLGVGQLEALMMYREISKTFDFSKFHEAKKALERKIKISKERIDEIELQKEEVTKRAISFEEKAEKMRGLSHMENYVRKESKLPVLVRDNKLLENVLAVQNLYPSILDYAVNIGLARTNEQWTTFLKENGDLESELHLRSVLDDFGRLLSPPLNHIPRSWLSGLPSARQPADAEY